MRSKIFILFLGVIFATVAQGLALIDAGHYGTEYIFMDAMKKELTQAFPELKISCAEVKSPYTIL